MYMYFIANLLYSMMKSRTSNTENTGLLLFWGTAPGMAELWASTGATWRDMLLAAALNVIVIVIIINESFQSCGY